MQPPERQLETVRALYRYDAQSGDELSIAENDVIEVLDRHTHGDWWMGRIGTREGLFPSTYVQQ